MRTLIFIFLLSSPAFALETDNYLVWLRNLESSEAEINDHLSSEIRASLRTTDASMSCEQVTTHVSKVFRSFLAHHNPIENWLLEHLSKDQIYPQTIDYVSTSIYRDPFRFYLPKMGLAPNIMVNGIYFGTDKLSHFASTGHHYFTIYRSLREKMGEEKAEEAAILYGATDEKMVHGYWSSGVFSFGDLEANYQGLQFYKRMCQGNSPYLKNNGSQWELSRGPRISEYVSPLWDETFNPSYFLPKNWEKIAPVLKAEYCREARSFRVLERLGRYLIRGRTSFSSKTLLKLQATKLVPLPQSFTELCLKN